MSTSTLWKVYKTTAHEIEEYRNSHGSAPPVWDTVQKEYLHEDGYYITNDKIFSKIIAQYKNPELPDYLRFGLLCTCDGALMPSNMLKECAEYCQKLYHHFNTSAGWGPTKVNHWQAFADTLSNLKTDKRCLGIGLGCTSVCDPWEEWRWSKGKDGHETFDVIKELNAIGEER